MEAAREAPEWRLVVLSQERLHRIKGYRHLPLLREALQREIASNAPRQENVA